MVKSSLTKQNRKRLLMLMLVVTLSCIASGMSVITAILGDRWANRKNTVAVSPNQIDLPYPFTYVDSYASTINEDSEIKNFAFKFIKLTRDRSIISSYQALTTDTRYVDVTMFSNNLLIAIDMTAIGSPERLYINDEFKRSNEVYKVLKEKKVSNHFLIHAMKVDGMPDSGGMKVFVIGQYENYFDDQKSPLPAEMLGGRIIEMIVVKGEIAKDVNGDVVNPYGYYVYSTVDQFIDRPIMEQIVKDLKAGKRMDF